MFRVYKIYKKVVLIIIMLGVHFFALGSNMNQDSVFLTKLPPLSYLIELAYKNSPLIKSQENIIEQKELEIRIEKKTWLKYVSLNGNYSRGTNNTQTNGNTIFQNYTSSEVNWYNAGVNLNLPFSAISNRKHRTSIKRVNQLIEENNLELIRREIKLLIADQYVNVELKLKTLELRGDALLQSNLNYEYAQIEFNNNAISIADLSKVHEENVKAKINYEESKKDYWLSIKNLEVNIGQKIK